MNRLRIRLATAFTVLIFFPKIMSATTDFHAVSENHTTLTRVLPDFSIYYILTGNTTSEPDEPTQQDRHSIVKRQNSLAPFFSQTSYTFSSQCSPGSYVGQVNAISYGGGALTYSVDNSLGNSYYVCVNPVGTITINTQPTGGFQFLLRATNNYGGAVVPVIITCSGYVSGVVTQPILNYYPYNTGINTGLGYPYSGYPYNTGYNPYGTTSQCNTGIYPFG